MSDVVTRPTPDRAGRVAALDGLRGFTILFVVLGHAYLIWPTELVADIPVVRGPFLGGTVTVFFVIGGFVVARGLLADQHRDTFDPLRFYLRRLVRLGAQLSVLMAAVLVMSSLDPGSGSGKETWISVMHVETYTWNVMLEQDPLGSRADLGHLWYLSVQQQVYLVLPLFLAVFARSRRVMAALLAVGIVAVVTLRTMWLPEIGYWPDSLRAVTRADGLLLGVLIAVGISVIERLRRFARPVFGVSLVAMFALVLVSGEVGEFQYLRWWGAAVMVVSGLLVASIVVHPGTGTTLKVLTARPMARLGSASYSIYLWHYPVFWFLARHAPEWAWPARVGVAAAVVAGLVVVMERFVEEPVRRLLGEHPVFRIRPADHTEVASRPVPSEARS